MSSLEVVVVEFVLMLTTYPPSPGGASSSSSTTCTISSMALDRTGQFYKLIKDMDGKMVC